MGLLDIGIRTSDFGTGINYNFSFGKENSYNWEEFLGNPCTIVNLSLIYFGVPGCTRKSQYITMFEIVCIVKLGYFFSLEFFYARLFYSLFSLFAQKISHVKFNIMKMSSCSSFKIFEPWPKLSHETLRI